MPSEQQTEHALSSSEEIFERVMSLCQDENTIPANQFLPLLRNLFELSQELPPSSDERISLLAVSCSLLLVLESTLVKHKLLMDTVFDLGDQCFRRDGYARELTHQRDQLADACLKLGSELHALQTAISNIKVDLTDDKQ